MYTATTIVKNYIFKPNHCSTIIIITIIIIKEVITSDSSFTTPTRDIEAVAHICYNAGDKAISIYGGGARMEQTGSVGELY
jgi:hypothetical protein